MANSIGHAKTYSSSFNVTAQKSAVEVGTLQLVPVNKSLKEVVVNSKKQFIERKTDRVIVNVDASISSAGSTALEVLEKSPGVTVDKDGNISLKGKQNVMVMLDGKPAYLSGADLTNMLKSTPSGNIDQIEIMTNPSAKYDAAGNSGIINIKTKKNKAKGFNGNFSTTYTQGIYATSNNSLNLNYKKGKINLFGSISANERNAFENIAINRKYYNNSSELQAIFDQNSIMKKKRQNFNAKLGLDVNVNKKTTVGFVLTGYSAPNKTDVFNPSFLKNKYNLIDSMVVANSNEDNSWKNGGVNINFRKIIDSTGRELTADVDYLSYRSVTNQELSNKSYFPDFSPKTNELIIGELPKTINVYSAKIDYVHPLKNGIKLETGVKSSYVKTDNTAGYFYSIGGVKVVDNEKTNHFKYKENINAIYLNASKEYKKWGLQAGLRAENTNIDGHQFGNPIRTDSTFSRSYTNLFPTLFVSYNANAKNQFSISYGRRIDRPDYEDLNPFFSFLDKYTYEAGNPFLKSMYSNTFEAAHTYNQFLTTTFNYTFTKDLFTQTFEENGFATIIRQENYGKKHSANLSVSAQVPVTKWWTAIIYTEANYNNYIGRIYGKDLDISATNMLMNINNQFKFKKGWSAEISGFYRTSGIEGQISVNPLGQMDAGIQKTILKNKGTLKIGARDILRTMAPSGTVNFQNTKASFSQYRDSRVGSLTFSYRFGKPIKGQAKRKTGGAGDEQNRIKGAN